MLLFLRAYLYWSSQCHPGSHPPFVHNTNSSTKSKLRSSPPVITVELPVCSEGVVVNSLLMENMQASMCSWESMQAYVRCVTPQKCAFAKQYLEYSLDPKADSRLQTWWIWIYESSHLLVIGGAEVSILQTCM
eukprot:scaffold202092_cov16-Tisochrysis_lutea.AAC.1